jgi:hypothetical protein
MNPIWWVFLFPLNLFCKWRMKREGWTDEDMSELQRRMLGDYSHHADAETMEAAE